MSAVLLNEIYKETTLDFLLILANLLLPHRYSAGIFPSVYTCRRASEHQEELKSVKTEFIKEDREKMRDPEPCRIKHTEDTEQQTGCCLLFILH